jgi:nucleoid DNA-binding protein
MRLRRRKAPSRAMATKKTASGPSKSGAKKPRPKALTKSALFDAIATEVGDAVTKKQVKQIHEALVTVAERELKKNGIITLPGFAKFVVVKKPARPARVGKNPFTGEAQKFAAKPASKAVKARPVKALKDVVA